MQSVLDPWYNCAWDESVILSLHCNGVAEHWMKVVVPLMESGQNHCYDNNFVLYDTVILFQ